MNQRIDILAAQARKEVQDKFGQSDAYCNLIMQRFAELIIKECAWVCQEEYDSTWIMEHFGLK